MFSEDTARWLLVLHTALAVATVGALTHLVLWMRHYWRGDTRRHRAVRKFAVVSLVLFATNFIVGNVVYPTYRTRTRAEFLDNAPVVAEAALGRAERHARAADRNRAPIPEVSVGRAQRAAQLQAVAAQRQARWFDVKEHVVALGLAMNAALTLILLIWAPSRDPDSAPIAPLTFLMALAAASSVWVGAVIGVITAAWRAF